MKRRPSQARCDFIFQRWNGERHALLDQMFDGRLSRRGRKRLALVSAEMSRAEWRSPRTRRERLHRNRMFRELDALRVRIDARLAETRALVESAT